MWIVSGVDDDNTPVNIRLSWMVYPKLQASFNLVDHACLTLVRRGHTMNKALRKFGGVESLEHILILNKTICNPIVRLRKNKISFEEHTTQFNAPSRSSSAILISFRRSISAYIAISSEDLVDSVPVTALRLMNSRHALSRLATNPASPTKLLVTIPEFLWWISDKAWTYAFGSSASILAPPSPTSSEIADNPARRTWHSCLSQWLQAFRDTWEHSVHAPQVLILMKVEQNLKAPPHHFGVLANENVFAFTDELFACLCVHIPFYTVLFLSEVGGTKMFHSGYPADAVRRLE